MNMPGRTNVQVQRIRAIGLTVADVERSKDFYEQALSFETVSDITVAGQDYSQLEGVAEAKIRIVTLQLGDERIELWEYLTLRENPYLSIRKAMTLWFQHLAIVVSDMDRAYAHLRSFPIDPISIEPANHTA